MPIKTVVEKERKIIVCDITGEEITANEISHRANNNTIIISKKGWELLPADLRREPFLSIVVKMLPNPGLHGRDILGISTGLWVIYDHPITPNCYNYMGSDRDNVYLTLDDVCNNLRNSSHAGRHFSIFENGKYVITVTPEVEVKLKSSNVWEDCDEPEITIREG